MAVLWGATHAIYSVRGYCYAIASDEPQCRTGYEPGSPTLPLASAEFLFVAAVLVAAGALLSLQTRVIRLNEQGGPPHL